MDQYALSQRETVLIFKISFRRQTLNEPVKASTFSIHCFLALDVLQAPKKVLHRKKSSGIKWHVGLKENGG